MDLTIELTTEKRENLTKLVKKFKNQKLCTVREYSQMIGKLVAACPAIEYGWLYTKILEREKIKILSNNHMNYDSNMNIPNEIQPDLEWWNRALKSSKLRIKSTDFASTICTDASDSGWGATNSRESTYGLWNKTQYKWHINLKELFVVKLALETLAKDVKNCQILLRVDNTTAIAYVNRMGGSRYPKFNSLAREIWQWAEKRNNFLFASYIPSRDNSEADALSRLYNDDAEWELAPYAFNEITNCFGSVDIDLFVTRRNAKCKRFCSRFPDSKAEQIDALTLSWSDLKFYAFPPFALILKMLAKIRHDRATGVVVVPNCPSQPWYPLFQELLIGEPLKLRPNEDLLLSPCRKKQHPNSQHLELLAGILSTRRSGEKVHHRRP